MATTDRSVLDAFFFVLALFALVVLVSILALAIVGGIVSGTVAGGTLGTPGVVISLGGLVLLLAALTALVLDQTRY